ncbi:uncharacterized protein LOC142645346 isoform X2 [Dermatophagoides pteronyssinus]|uniref:uncharacterized protein LOC142645346 isoform X2 n=1 Tax=Dermatophagoides pteronyssinus TaxID=6956 RepID=UPI003F663F22
MFFSEFFVCTDVEEDLLYRLSINSLESRLNVLLFIEEKHKELKSIFQQQQQQHLSSFKIDSLLNEISNCFMKMKSITEKVLELKRNQKEEKKLNQIVKDSFRYDEEPKKMDKSNFIEHSDITRYNYAYQLSTSLSSQSLVQSESSRSSSTSKLNDNNDINDYDDIDPSPSACPIDGDDGTNTHKSSKCSIENPKSPISSQVMPFDCVKFDVFFNEGDEFYIYNEWRQWFNFNPELDKRLDLRFNNEKIQNYFQQPEDNNIDDFHQSLHKIFSDTFPWIKDEKLNQIRNLTINSKKDLLLLVECVYYKCHSTRDIGGQYDTILSICSELFDEIGVPEDETDSIFDTITFGQLLSSKCRSSFFIHDINEDQTLSYLRNAKLISKLCEIETFDPRIIIVCLSFLCQQQKQPYFEAFVQIVRHWYGIGSLKKLFESSSNAQIAIDLIFDKLEQFILYVEKQRKDFFEMMENASTNKSAPSFVDKPQLSAITFEKLKDYLKDYDFIFHP